MSEPVLITGAALVVGLCGSFGSGIARFANEPSPKLPGVASP
jgi:hypothetical protein